MIASFTKKQAGRNGTNSTVNADFRCQYTDAPFDCSVLYSEQDNLFSVPHEIKCSQ